MKIGILGAGAIGSLVGAHLKKGGGEVWFVDIYEEHMEAIQDNGLVMELDGEAVPQNVFIDGAVTRASEAGPCDVVIVLVKCVDTEYAIESNEALFGKNTVVITLQNGIGAADILASYFDQKRIGLGVLKSNANLLGPGKIAGRLRFPNSPKSIYFSPASQNTPHLNVYKELEKYWCEGGMPVELSDKTEEFIWGKLCDNAMYNGIAALLLLSNEDAAGHEDGWLLMRELMRETIEVAEAKGIKLDPNNYWRDRTGRPPFDRSRIKDFHYVSALIDSYKKRTTEIDFINGAIVREGRKLGIPTPYNETIWRLVRVMQDNYDYRYNA